MMMVWVRWVLYYGFTLPLRRLWWWLWKRPRRLAPKALADGFSYAPSSGKFMVEQPLTRRQQRRVPGGYTPDRVRYRRWRTGPAMGLGMQACHRKGYDRAR